MKRWAIPDDWNAEEDGYISVLFCIPNSRKWRGLIVGLIESLSFGWGWDGLTGTVTDVQSVGRDIFESMNMGCIEELVQIQVTMSENLDRIATALEAGAQLSTDLSDLNTTLQSIDSRLTTDNLIYPNENVADILMGGLIGRQLDLDFPWSGEGLADILDEQVETLHERFTMADSSIFNLFGEKNIVEALETLLRKDSFADIEILPNIASILDKSFNLYQKPEGILGPGEGEEEALVEQNFKTFLIDLARKLGVPQFLISKLETERINTAHLLLLIAQTLGNDESAKSIIANALVELDASTVVNINNGCGCEGDCNCSEAKTVYSSNGSVGGGDVPLIDVDVT